VTTQSSLAGLPSAASTRPSSAHQEPTLHDEVENPTTKADLLHNMDVLNRTTTSTQFSAVSMLRRIASDQVIVDNNEEQNCAFYWKLVKEVLRGERTLATLAFTIRTSVLVDGKKQTVVSNGVPYSLTVMYRLMLQAAPDETPVAAAKPSLGRKY